MSGDGGRMSVICGLMMMV